MYKYAIFPGNNARSLLKPLLDQRGNWVEQDTSELKCNFVWKPEQLTVKELLQLENYSMKFPIQSLNNHLENHREITTKTGLIRSLRGYYTNSEQALLHSYQTHDSIPTSFIITAQYEDFEYQSLMSRFNELNNLHSNKERTPVKHCLKNIWLIKPAALNQGKGIELCRSTKEITRIIRNKPSNSMWIVQKYIEKPLLFYGRKFDIRVWAFATAKKELFFYNKGYIRTSSFEYDTEAKDNYIHLTNNCLQQHGDMYGIFEEGNTIGFELFQKYLSETFPQHNLDFETQFVPRMKDLIIDSYLSCKKVLHKSKKLNAFEFFGYDFLIDEDFRVWLIEVNTNPYLGIPNDYIDNLLPVMLDDMLDITLDPLFEPSVKRARKINDFELLYCEVSSPYSKDCKAVNKRQSFSISLYPIPELAQLPLCKQCIAHRYEEDTSKVQIKDTFQLVKIMTESPSNYDSAEFLSILSKVLKQALSSPEQNPNNTEALKLLLHTISISDLTEIKYLKKLMSLLNQNPSDYDLCKSLILPLIQICKNISMRKYMCTQGITQIYINIILSNCPTEIKTQCIDGLVNLCHNPDRGIYVPGKSQEMKFIKEKFILQGGIIILVHLLLANTEESLKAKILSLVESDFTIEDFKRQATIISENLNGFGEFSLKLHEIDMSQIEAKIETFVSNKVKELLNKQEQVRKIKEEHEKKQIELELKNKQLEVVKRQKVEEYIKKKTQEIKKTKIEILKATQQEREAEERILNEKRMAILMKKRIEGQRCSSLKKSFTEEKGLKRLENARRKIDQKNRKKLVKEWVMFKCQLEKSILKHKTKERLKTDVNKVLSGFRTRPFEKVKASEFERRSVSIISKDFIPMQSQKLIRPMFFCDSFDIEKMHTVLLPKSIDLFSKLPSDIKDPAMIL